MIMFDRGGNGKGGGNDGCCIIRMDQDMRQIGCVKNRCTTSEEGIFGWKRIDQCTVFGL